MNKPIVFGLTGGIASGKSTITNLFISEGVPMIDADKISRELVEPGKPVLKLLITAFGSSIVKSDGSLDRSKLGEIVFSDVKARQSLDEIMHQYIFDEIRKRIQQESKRHNLIGVDAALLIERGYSYKPLIVVSVPKNLQIQRLMLRSGLSEEQALARIDSQISLEERLSKADIVIDNSGSLDELVLKSLKVLAHLKTNAKNNTNFDERLINV